MVGLQLQKLNTSGVAVGKWMVRQQLHKLQSITLDWQFPVNPLCVKDVWVEDDEKWKVPHRDLITECKYIEKVYKVSKKRAWFHENLKDYDFNVSFYSNKIKGLNFKLPCMFTGMWGSQ